MKLVFAIADAGCLDELRANLRRFDVPGYTILPVAEGSGRTGLHTGDRVHPGALAAVMIVAQDDQATQLFDELVRCRDAMGDHVSRFFLLPVERQA
jgi:nitrogen regulatory protein PII